MSTSYFRKVLSRARRRARCIWWLGLKRCKYAGALGCTLPFLPSLTKNGKCVNFTPVYEFWRDSE